MVFHFRLAVLSPLAEKLQGAFKDGFADGLVGRDLVQPFGPDFALVGQEVDQAQSFVFRT